MRVPDYNEEKPSPIRPEYRPPAFDDILFGSTAPTVESKQNNKIVILFIAIALTMVCAVIAGIILTANLWKGDTQSVQSVHSAQSSQGISYQPTDFEYDESRCNKMYSTKDNHLLWSCAKGTLELGAPSTEPYPDARTELPLSVPLYDKTSVEISPDTIKCYSSQLCTASGTLNQRSALYLFTPYDPLVQAVYFSYEDVANMSNAEIAKIAQQDRVIPGRYQDADALYIGFQFSPVYSCEKTDCTLTGTTSVAKVKE